MVELASGRLAELERSLSHDAECWGVALVPCDGVKALLAAARLLRQAVDDVRMAEAMQGTAPLWWDDAARLVGCDDSLRPYVGRGDTGEVANGG